MFTFFGEITNCTYSLESALSKVSSYVDSVLQLNNMFLTLFYFSMRYERPMQCEWVHDVINDTKVYFQKSDRV